MNKAVVSTNYYLREMWTRKINLIIDNRNFMLKHTSVKNGFFLCLKKQFQNKSNIISAMQNIL